MGHAALWSQHITDAAHITLMARGCLNITKYNMTTHFSALEQGSLVEDRIYSKGKSEKNNEEFQNNKYKLLFLLHFSYPCQPFSCSTKTKSCIILNVGKMWNCFTRQCLIVAGQYINIMLLLLYKRLYVAIDFRGHYITISTVMSYSVLC